VALAACATSHYWAKEIMKGGYTVKLILPQHVKAFLMGNKIPITGKSLLINKSSLVYQYGSTRSRYNKST
jgi:transposase